MTVQIRAFIAYTSFILSGCSENMLKFEGLVRHDMHIQQTTRIDFQCFTNVITEISNIVMNRKFKQ